MKICVFLFVVVFCIISFVIVSKLLKSRLLLLFCEQLLLFGFALFSVGEKIEKKKKNTPECIALYSSKSDNLCVCVCVYK